MKKTHRLLYLCLMSSLVSCGNLSTSINSFFSSLEVSYDNYYLAESVKHTTRDLNEQINWSTSITTGEQKMLIVPVKLTDAPSWNETMLSNLEKAFFGKSEDTTFESVASFYHKSSYGALNLTGEVTEVLEFTSREYTIANLNMMGQYASDIIAAAFYEVADSSLLEKYDLDKDGYVDNCIFIYSNEYSSDRSSAYWAWCYYADIDNSLNKTSINNYMWASYHFIFDDYVDNYRNGYVDAHTYIHETGHLLGLADYYCQDIQNVWDCAGSLEMQSYNVGDHNAFSKMALGWLRPYVVTGNAKIKLKTSALYPEAILIGDDWNGSSYDEYILIEYYTPQGLNKVDAEHQYDDCDLMYDYNGLRIYHIDARLAQLKYYYGNYNFVSYVDDFVESDSYITYVGASNSSSASFLKEQYRDIYRYIHLLDQGENNKLNNGIGGEVDASSALWTGEKTFIPSSTFFANDTKFNDGSEIGYSVSVDNLTDEDCEVIIRKLI